VNINLLLDIKLLYWVLTRYISNQINIIQPVAIILMMLLWRRICFEVCKWMIQSKTSEHSQNENRHCKSLGNELLNEIICKSVPSFWKFLAGIRHMADILNKLNLLRDNIILCSYVSSHTAAVIYASIVYYWIENSIGVITLFTGTVCHVTI